MKLSLLDLLISPLDESRLTLEAEAQTDDEILAGHLRDTSGNRFPIVDGIPLFAENMAYDETFAFKWERIGDTYGHEEQTRISRQNWYLERFGFNHRPALIEFLATKSLILDAGAGSGVDSAMFTEASTSVVAVDLNYQAVSAVYRRLGQRPNLHVIQADLNHLPFPAQTFDYISCDQVLHHLPDTPQAFTTLTNHLKANGHIALYVYNRKGPIREFSDDYLRQYTTKLTPLECYQFCEAITRLGQALSDLKTKVTVPQDIPLLGIKAGSQDVQRFIYWNVLKCFWNDAYDFTTNVIINFDWYHPKYASRHTAEEVQGWFDAHHFEVDQFQVVPSGIAVLGRLRNAVRRNY